MRRPPVLPLLLLLLLLALAAAAPARAEPRAVAGGAAAALDAVTLRLADGGVLRLAGLVAPDPPLGYRGVWRTAERARNGLAALAAGATLEVEIVGADRWGRALGRAALPDGRDLAQVLLAAGWAMVAGHGGPPAPAAAASDATASGLAASDAAASAGPASDRELALRLEAEARAAERGLWSDAYYQVRAAETLPAELTAGSVAPGRFLLVEGRVRDVAVVRGRAYLNFGPDWRSDFTATLSPDARRSFRAAGLDVRDWQGRRLRLRGWLLSWNGPMIELGDPGQVELLAEDE